MLDLYVISVSLKPAKKSVLPQGLPKFKRAENCPNFFFFFIWAGTLWALVTSPKGPEKLPHSVPKGKGKFFQGSNQYLENY
jgi:hypothetical protein